MSVPPIHKNRIYDKIRRKRYCYDCFHHFREIFKRSKLAQTGTGLSFRNFIK